MTSSNVPMLFKVVEWKPNTVNRDLGGGLTEEETTLYLKVRDVTNLVYDPTYKTPPRNESVIAAVIRYGMADSITLSNVLNTIRKWKSRDSLLYYCKHFAKRGSPIHISICEGDGAGVGKETEEGWSANIEACHYVELINSRFRVGKVTDSVITAIRE